LHADSYALTLFVSILCSHKELVKLTFETIRERYHGLPLPAQIAKVITAPREALLNRVRCVPDILAPKITSISGILLTAVSELCATRSNH